MPNRVPWSPSYNVGHPLVDSQHQALLAQPNFVRDLLARPAQPIHRGGSLPEAMDPEDLPKIAVLPV